MNPNQNPKQETGIGPTMGIFIIIALMIIGAVYYAVNEAQQFKARKEAYDAAIAASTTTEIITATTTATTTP